MIQLNFFGKGLIKWLTNFIIFASNFQILERSIAEHSILWWLNSERNQIRGSEPNEETRQGNKLKNLI